MLTPKILPMKHQVVADNFDTTCMYCDRVIWTACGFNMWHKCACNRCVYRQDVHPDSPVRKMTMYGYALVIPSGSLWSLFRRWWIAWKFQRILRSLQ